LILGDRLTFLDRPMKLISLEHFPVQSLMQPAFIQKARQLASLALTKGLLSPDMLWDVLQRLSRSDAPQELSALFSGMLSPKEIESLTTELNQATADRTRIYVREEGGSLSAASFSESTQEDLPPVFKRSAPSSGYANVKPMSGGYSIVKPSPSGGFASVKPNSSRAVPAVSKTPPPRPLTQNKTQERPASAVAERYLFLNSLGQGSEGRVIAVNDRLIGRTVALKTLLQNNSDEQTKKRFLNEAQLTAKLEHPSIVPVYDLGALPDESPFYTMRVVKRLSLKEILENEELRSSWSLARLCGVFVQVCRAMSYAHSKGVVHRDLKPANILLGDYGEVYVADWGIAKVLDDAPTESELSQGSDTATRVENEEGLIIGSPGYMSPEQARSEWSSLDQRSDIFSLGAILYELLTRQRPFQGKTNRAVLLATLGQDPAPPRTLVPNCPLSLEDLCLKMLSKDRADRPSSAAKVADEVEAFLEGAKERERRRQEAERLVKEAAGPASDYVELGRERDRLLRDARGLLRDVKPFDPVEKKRPAWSLQQQARVAEAEQARALASAIELYNRALGIDPQCSEAKKGLAQLYWMRACEAESDRNEPSRIYYESLVRDLDDGRYKAFLSSDARLSLRSSPPGARVTAIRYQERDQVLVPIDEAYLGETPLREARLGVGNYTLLIQMPGYRDVRLPILASRGQHQRLQVNLYTDREIGLDFVYVPGGGCIIGGDPEALNSLPRQEAEVGDFAIARFPVTIDEYASFLNDLWQKDPKLAEKRMPHDDTDRFLRLENGRWIPDYDLCIEGDGRKFCPPEMLGATPVDSIDWFDALAYCRWKGSRDSNFYRLPLDIEWEKAARGTDGRNFPWGDGFDPTFCKMSESRPGYRQPEPIGTFQTDESPYGVRDMAGGVREWVGDIYGELELSAAVQEKEPSPNSPRDQSGIRLTRGGGWSSLVNTCRLAARVRLFSFMRSTGIGFRLAKKLRSDREQ
jgi:formylglycine-generating enzyme required for sulfatase activity/tRNA A-37 threonylcarbamoyl transferase component Bud32